MKLYTSCSQPGVTTPLHYITLQPTLSHCTTSHSTIHSHPALHHTTAYTLTLHYITLQPTLSHCTTSHYTAYTLTLHYITLQPTLSHCTTSHYSLHSHTALHHTTAYTLTLHYITQHPTLSHCTTSHYCYANTDFGVSSSLDSSQSHHPDLHQFSQHIFVAPLLICTPPHFNVV